MAAVTKEFLIESLFVSPTSEREIGYNAALITILKKLADISVDSTPDLASFPDEAFLKKAFEQNGFPTAYQLTTKQFRAELIRLIRNKEKLQAVKNVKEVTQLALKEAKDVVDKFAELINV